MGELRLSGVGLGRGLRAEWDGMRRGEYLRDGSGG